MIQNIATSTGCVRWGLCGTAQEIRTVKKTARSLKPLVPTPQCMCSKPSRSEEWFLASGFFFSSEHLLSDSMQEEKYIKWIQLFDQHLDTNRKPSHVCHYPHPIPPVLTSKTEDSFCSLSKITHNLSYSQYHLWEGNSFLLFICFIFWTISHLYTVYCDHIHHHHPTAISHSCPTPKWPDSSQLVTLFFIN